MNQYTPHLVSSILLLTSLAAADESRWYTVEMFGSKAGYMHVNVSEKEEVITTRTSIVFDMKRGATGINIQMTSEFVESAAGNAISMKSVQKLGATALTQTYTFTKDDQVELVTDQGGQTTRSTLKRPEGNWLTPAAADRHAREQLAAGSKEIIIKSIDPFTSTTVVTSTRKIGERIKVKVAEKEYDALESTVTLSNQPGIASKEFIDDAGDMIKSETKLGGIGVVMFRSTEEEAKKSGGGGGSGGEVVAPEVFTSTFIKPDKPIADARKLTRGVYILSANDGNDVAELPQTGTQQVQRLAKDRLKVTVLTGEYTPAPEADSTDPKFLASTAVCNTEDEKIREVAARVMSKLSAEERKDSMVVAKACRDFVYTYIRKKSLNVGFATATEVVRTREGDCSEHGVLLCALLRTNGIPARVASGLIYADSFAGSQNIFGYHMWAQALIKIDGVYRWVDVDATLPDGIMYDATHITMGVSDLADGELSQSMMSIATNMGRLVIQVSE